MYFLESLWEGQTSPGQQCQIYPNKVAMHMNYACGLPGVPQPTE